MSLEKLFEGVFSVDGKLATVNFVPGTKVYGEELVSVKGTEYRIWNPYRSKLAAAILKGLKEFHISPGSAVLYLGAATGTTCSHVSDIVGKEGAVYCIDIAERSLRELIKVCEKRTNMLPILHDALDPDFYKNDTGKTDVLYQDVSSRMQAEILLRNSQLLKKGGYAYVAIKSQSIDSSKRPRQVYDAFIESVSEKFEVLETIDIAPYSLLHLFAVMKKI
ncbi:MAG: fibrillarin-like rRNA/tRNA 2'-O-methyltransferase [Candidatus Micrarchaeia archaeon]